MFRTLSLFVCLFTALADVQVLGPGDQIQIRALHAAELAQAPVRLDSNGAVMLPLVGRIMAAGMTPNQLADEIRGRLAKLVKDPEVSIDIVELKSRPVSVLGAVKSPGVYQIVGRKRLLEVLSMAGGLDADAGHGIHISREGAAGKPEVLEISVAELLDARDPARNVVVHPQDSITVPRGQLVYVIGEVRRPGGFLLREREQMTVLQALSMAEGLSPAAGPRHARILRPAADGGRRTEIAVNIGNLLSGKTADQPLQANDILVVPNNLPKSAALRGLDAAIQMGTGMAIWRR